MAITSKTRKLLWGKSANRCNICQKELSVEQDGDSYTIVGEECHIVAKKNDGPRGKNKMTSKERDEYNNLVLMCEHHHKVIDNDTNKYTVEVLKEIKRNHEKWVSDNLDKLQVEDLEFDYEDIKFESEVIEDIYTWILENYDTFKYKKEGIPTALNRLQYLDKKSRKILYKFINYYYKNKEIDIKSIMNKVINDEILTEEEFFRIIEFLEKQEFIKFEEENIDDLLVAEDGRFIDAYSNVVYRCLNKECYLFKNGYILMLIGRYIDDKKVFKKIIQDLEYEYI